VLRLRQEGMTALVVYAGDGHAVVPLTDDVATIENLLGALDPGMMPVLGSNPGHALELATELFSNANMSEGRILMISDGIDRISSVTSHRSRAFPISIIGVGSYEGGAIPLEPPAQSRRYLLSQEGNQIIALLDEQRLAEVASLSYGKYARLTVSDDDITHALSTPLPTEDASIEVEREFDIWFDQGHWLALALLPLCLFAFAEAYWCYLLYLLACLALKPLQAKPQTPPLFPQLLEVSGNNFGCAMINEHTKP
jgi:Ca-activated chloride channel family protein